MVSAPNLGMTLLAVTVAIVLGHIVIKNVLHEKIFNENVPKSMQPEVKTPKDEEEELLNYLEEEQPPMPGHNDLSGVAPSGSYATQNSRSDFGGQGTDLSGFFNDADESARASNLMNGTMHQQLEPSSLMSMHDEGEKLSDVRWQYENEKVHNGGGWFGGVKGYTDPHGYASVF